MDVYSIDKGKLEEILRFFEAKCAEAEEAISHLREGELPDQRTHWLHLASERLLLLFLEMFTDVAAMLIDGFIMRDPGSYEDMADILEDEEVIDSRSAACLKGLIQICRRLEKDYLSVTREDVTGFLSGSLPFLRQFPQQIRDYVQKELP